MAYNSANINNPKNHMPSQVNAHVVERLLKTDMKKYVKC